jgi:hypothetical protein
LEAALEDRTDPTARLEVEDLLFPLIDPVRVAERGEAGRGGGEGEEDERETERGRTRWRWL